MVVASPLSVSGQPGSQWDFLGSSARECAMLGEAGGGKSYALILDFLYDIAEPEHNGLLLRKTYKDLEDLIAKTQRIYPSFDAEYSDKKHCWTFPSGAKLWLSYLDHDKDVFRYDGWELSWIGLDEANQFGKMVYFFLFTRNRCANPRIIKRMRLTGIPNPNSIGTAWLWDRFCNSLQSGELGYFTTSNNKDIRVKKGDPDAVSRQWFFSDRSQNKALMDADPEYEATLSLLPEQLKNAYKFGVFKTASEPDALIKAEWLDAAINGKNTAIIGQRAFGLDYAESGNDKSVKTYGEGNQVQDIQEWDWVPHPEMARIVAGFFSNYGKYQLVGGIDSVGTGAGVYRSMMEIKDIPHERINPVRYKDESFEAKYLKDAIKYKFRNIQDQMLWQLREDFQAGKIDLSPLVTTEHYYPNIDKLREELLSFYFKVQDDKVWISGTKELRKLERQRADGSTIPSLGRSPDRAKSLAIWNWCRQHPPVHGAFSGPGRIDGYDTQEDHDQPSDPFI